ncbi:MAG: EpsG family protein, partial [Clostridia bacterium]|nr:EpsG family protein [Clostridia bacterium]
MVFYAMFACMPLLVGLAVKLYYQCPINESKRAKRAFIIFSGLILWFIIAFRDKSVGSLDSGRYYERWVEMAFRNVEGLIDNIARNRIEPVYLCTIWVLSHIFPEGQWLFILTGILYSVSVSLYIYRNSDNVVLSYVMYIALGGYTFMVQGLRQAIAISICLFAIESVKKRKIFRFIFQVLLAFCYHRSALAFAVLYFIPWKRLCLVNILQMLACAVVLFFSANILLEIGAEITKSDYSGSVEGGGYIALSVYLIILVLALLFMQHSKPVEDKGEYKVVLLSTAEDRRKETLFVVMVGIGATFYCMRYSSAVILERT